MTVFSRTISLPVSAQQAFNWHERPGAFSRLTPPWENVELIDAEGGIQDGAKVVVKVKPMGPFGFTAVYRHVDYISGVRFVDIQEKGPFKSWRHEHRFHPDGPDACMLEDHITFEAPPFSTPLVTRRLDRMFRYRHAMTLGDLAYETRVGLVKPQTVLVSGASGLVGQALIARLTTRGHHVKTLSRQVQKNGFQWDPSAGTIERNALDGIDTVIHLAGENIAQRWTPQIRKRILESRVEGARLLVEAIGKSDRRPTYISASGINYYGNQHAKPMTEEDPAHSNFLATVCEAWEGVAKPLIEAGNRCAFLRIGVVLSARGGALATMLPAFRAGVAGRIGSGKQQMSWVALDDLVDQLLNVVEDDNLSGPINAVAPAPLSNLDFTRALGRTLKRPTLVPVPPAPLRLLLGGMAEETILADLSVLPKILTESGYAWRLPTIDACLRHELGV